MRFFGRARDSGQVLDQPGVCLISCGLNYAAFNAAVLSTPVGPPDGELADRIQVSAAHFRQRNLRWTYWLCDDYLDKPTQRRLYGSFTRFGLSPLTNPPGLYADRFLPPKRHLPVITIRRVSDDATRQAFAHITSVAFDIPIGVCRDIYGCPRAWTGSLSGFIGYQAGQAVCTAATVVTGDVIGIYSVATIPGSRRRGLAEAIMRAAHAEIREQTGIEATVLQSTSSGLSLYERMGYRRRTGFSVFIS